MFSNIPKDATIMSVQAGERPVLSKEAVMALAQDHAHQIVEACGPQDAVSVSLAVTKIVAAVVYEACGETAVREMLDRGNAFTDHMQVAVMDAKHLAQA